MGEGQVIKSVKLIKFRRHASLTLDLSPGLVVIRGANEAGKTTVLEAIGYAFFGARALREPLERVVTIGHNASELSVEVSFTRSDGTLYSLRRSKSGATLEGGGQTVTGHKDVTQALEAIFGAPAAMAEKIWFVSQNSIRGVLEAGPGAAASMIEELAEFSVIDRIVDLISTHLPTGNTQSVQARVAAARDTLAEYDNDSLQPPPDAESVLLDLDSKLADAVYAYTQAKQELATHDREVASPLLSAKGQLDAARDRIKSITHDITRRQNERKAVELPKYNKAEHDAVKTEWEKYKEELARRKLTERAFKLYSSLPKFDDAVWEGDVASLSKFAAELDTEMANLERQRAEMATEKLLAMQRVVNDMQCSFCERDLSQVPEVVRRNAEANERVIELAGLIDEASRQLQQLKENRAAVTKIERAQMTIEAALDSLQGYVEVSREEVPFHVKWKGETFSNEPMPNYEAQLANYEVAAGKLAMAKGRLAALDDELKRLALDRESWERKVDELEPKCAGFDQMIQESNRLTLRQAQTEQAVQALEQQRKGVEAEIESARKLWEMREKARQGAQRHLEQAEKDLAAVEFNNALLKAVRGCRPAIADRLWAAVLSAVSIYFSRMRGEPSIVGRDDKGFTVDGQGVAGLSGSTLDVLGLSIRLALLQTFVPWSDFLILDEPAAACDANRESALIGTTSASGFKQCLLVTHSDVADAFAQQLVQL